MDEETKQILIDCLKDTPGGYETLMQLIPEKTSNYESVTHCEVFCYECRQWKDFEVAGDLGQYTGDTLNCPCGEETVVPKCWAEGKWGLFHVGSLEAPSDVYRWLRLAGED